MAKNIVDKIVEILGGPRPAAARLKLSSTSVIWNWRARGRVPVQRVMDIEAATGISRHELRPDIFGPEPEKGMEV